jgi:hypothetical protein
MRFIIGFLSGALGMLAGWSGLAALVIAIEGPDRDGGLAMGAFFNIGPIGGLIGFVAGVLLFIKIGQVSGARVSSDQASQGASPPAAEQPAAAPAQTPKRVSRIYAVVILAIAAGLGWWGWYEFIRSPYLSHGYMTLQLQFRLPSGMALPSDVKDVHIAMHEGQQQTDVLIGRAWHGTDGDHRVILASASLSYKTSRRVVDLEIPGIPEQTWQLDLSSDPDPTPGYTPWRNSSGTSTPKVEMNYRLSADH